MEKDIAGSGGAGVVAELGRLCDELPAGSLLPPTRELQRRHQVSALTVQRALATLVRAGRLVVQPGRGSYVAAPRTTRRPDLSWQTTALGSRDELPHDMSELYSPVPDTIIDLSSGYLDPGLQPVGLLAAAAARAARRPHVWDRISVDGLTELRAHIAGLVGTHHDAGDVLITSGGQAALALTFRALAQPGDPVLFEHTTYPGALAAARAAGLHPVPVVADRDGVLPDALATTLRRTGARLVYLQPRHSNPTGSVLAPDRRGPVLDALVAHDAFAIEDDWVAPLDLDAPSPPPLAAGDDAGHVIHVLSLSKPVAPGLRIAALTSKGAATTRLRRVRIADDLFVAPVLQHTALEVLTAAGWARHLAALKRELRNRRHTLMTALAEHLPDAGPVIRPTGGVHLWMPLPAGTDDRELAAAARRAGVAISPGSAYTLGEPVAAHIRLTYCRTPGTDLIVAVERISHL
jgi:DNA-binding transcriptional MocR family regulator